MINIGNINVNSFKVGSADCKVYLGTELLYPSSTPSYENQHLTFVAVDGDCCFRINAQPYYSINGGVTWVRIGSNSWSPVIHSGESIMWEASLSPSYNVGIGHFEFSGNGHVNIEGNAMSLLYGENFSGQTDLSSKNYAFQKLFSGNTQLVSAKNLILPATRLSINTYSNMFAGCTSLTTAPELPATTIGMASYDSMFGGCTSLTKAPELPATNIGSYAYQYMFYGCTSLTTAPSVLPATTLKQSCYQYMFNGCSGLTTAPELPATTLADSCYFYMFNGCSSLSRITCLATNISAGSCTGNWVLDVALNGTFVKNPSMTGWGSCGANKIPCGWTVLDYTG